MLIAQRKLYDLSHSLDGFSHTPEWQELEEKIVSQLEPVRRICRMVEPSLIDKIDRHPNAYDWDWRECL